MKHMSNVFDLWIFCRNGDEKVRYLLLRTSEAKADKWFGGGQFWQIPCDYIEDAGKGSLSAIRGFLKRIGADPKRIFECEHVYTIYNRRFDALQTIPVFAAEVDAPFDVQLSWEHVETGWFTSDEAYERLSFRGLRDGLDRVRNFVTEPKEVRREFCLWRVGDPEPVTI